MVKRNLTVGLILLLLIVIVSSVVWWIQDILLFAWQQITEDDQNPYEEFTSSNVFCG